LTPSCEDRQNPIENVGRFVGCEFECESQEAIPTRR
jgi:hypothetical protein